MRTIARALVIAPHADDEVLGCGGTIAALTAIGTEVRVLIAGDDPRFEGIISCEALSAHATLGVCSTEFLGHPAIELARLPVAVLNSGIQRAVDEFFPDLVLAPFPDRHLDHKAIFEASMVASRPVARGRHISTVALYETVSETHWNVPGAEAAFTPDWFVDITSTIETKLTAFKQYASQVQQHPAARSLNALTHLAAFRGSQIGIEYVEAFQTVRHISRFEQPPEYATVKLPDSIGDR